MNVNELVKSISEKLIESIGKVRYGTCAVIITVHESNPVSVKHEIIEKTTKKQEVKS